jgi:uncharacterized membrane protein YeaQ/YmgE (transglycosylase-associated protein family)
MKPMRYILYAVVSAFVFAWGYDRSASGSAIQFACCFVGSMVVLFLFVVAVMRYMEN